MKIKTVLLMLAGWLLAGCAPHFHLDFLGESNLREKVLQPSPAREKVLVLDLTGIIQTVQESGPWQREGDIVSRIYQRLSVAAGDKDIKGVILRLDTPGGEVTASDILYHEILSFKERTSLPVVAMMMGFATSGGYYVASACDWIVAHPSTITGSIGVISIFPDLHELLKDVGVKVNIIKSGEMKDAGSPFKEMNKGDRDVFQEITDEMHGKFLDIVHRNRKDLIPEDKLKELADGRVYTAPQALQYKLIDQIGYFDAALDKVLALAGIKAARVTAYTHFPSRKTSIYAASSLSNAPFDMSTFYDKVFPTLKTGFYYLWLPHLPR